MNSSHLSKPQKHAVKFVAMCKIIRKQSFPRYMNKNHPNSLKEYGRGGRPATTNFSSEPHSPHFLVRATSKYSSFDYYVF